MSVSSAAIVVLINMVAWCCTVQPVHQGHCSRLSSVIPLTSCKKSWLKRNIDGMNVNLLTEERFKAIPRWTCAVQCQSVLVEQREEVHQITSCFTVTSHQLCLISLKYLGVKNHKIWGKNGLIMIFYIFLADKILICIFQLRFFSFKSNFPKQLTFVLFLWT